MATLESGARTPKNKRIYVVGDIHGRLDLLTRLVAMIMKDAERHPHPKKEIVFLGDYVDRGLHAKGVIDYFLTHMPRGIDAIYLCGNHDEALRRFLGGDTSILQSWLLLGGAATLASYGVNPYRAGTGEDPETLRQMLAEKIPPEHRNFLETLRPCYSAGDYFFAHAGVRPGVPLSEQKPEDLMWIRQTFLTSTEDFGQVVVHGHTVMPEPQVLPNQIGIDTGAYATGHLTCLILQDSSFSMMQT